MAGPGRGGNVTADQASSAFDVLVRDVLPVLSTGDDTFTGARPAASFDRIYGGETAAQGLRAAALTVEPGKLPHSLHVTYLRIGDPRRPVEYTVERLRDSRTFSTRWVKARQDERIVATMTASFQPEQRGFEHAVAPRSPIDSLAVPESLPRRETLLAQAFPVDPPQTARVPWPIDIRYLDRLPWAAAVGNGDARPMNRMWMRADGPLGDDPLDHLTVLAYASDLSMFEPVLYPHGGSPWALSWERVSRGDIRGASLDHTIWFHRPFRADEWLLHEQESTSAFGTRGLTTGRYYTADGRLVASVAQELALLVDPPSGG